MRRARTPLLVGATTVLAGVVVALHDPHVAGSYGICPVLLLTGLACPGCGGLRAVHDLAHLDLAAAWSMNPLVVTLLPLAVAAWTVWTWRALAGRPRPRPVPAGLLWALLVVVVVFAVARNVPALAPWLAP